MLYVYLCPKCNAETERLRQTSEKDMNTVCCKCGAKTNKRIYDVGKMRISIEGNQTIRG